MGHRELFATVIERFDEAELKGPDGMKFAANGDSYVAVFGQGVTVPNREGRVVRRLKTRGNHPTNLAFSQTRIDVTEAETGTLQVHDVETARLPLRV